MTLLRALSIPFHLTSVVFVALLSLILAVVIRYDTSGFLWLVPAIIAISWIFKYAFAMLESIADGETQAPVASIEMLSVFEQRPLILSLLLLAIGQFTLWMDNVAGYLLMAMLLALLPASIGILGSTGRAMLSLNPVAIVQTARGMGWYYLLILLVIMFVIAATGWLAPVVWKSVLYIQMGMSILVVFSLIGGVMYERRIEIGHEPRHSPERRLVHDQREHHRQLKQTLDEIYNAVRLGDLVRGMGQLEQWLATVSEDVIAADCLHIHSTVINWGDSEMTTAASRALITALVKVRQPEMVVEIIASTLRTLPDFTLKSENSLLTVVHSLQSLGKDAFALLLLKNFVNAFPAQVTPGIKALMQRLSAIKQ